MQRQAAGDGWVRGGATALDARVNSRLSIVSPRYNEEAGPEEFCRCMAGTWVSVTSLRLLLLRFQVGRAPFVMPPARYAISVHRWAICDMLLRRTARALLCTGSPLVGRSLRPPLHHCPDHGPRDQLLSGARPRLGTDPIFPASSSGRSSISATRRRGSISARTRKARTSRSCPRSRTERFSLPAETC